MIEWLQEPSYENTKKPIETKENFSPISKKNNIPSKNIYSWPEISDSTKTLEKELENIESNSDLWKEIDKLTKEIDKNKDLEDPNAPNKIQKFV